MEKLELFNLLKAEVQACRTCLRMCESRRVLDHSNGSINSRIMFIGEAPGRLGADDTGIPFHGDMSGINFEKLLESAKISRYEIFVTNAVLCNPKDSEGNNSTPSTIEMSNCSTFLKRQIDLINPLIVVTLGRFALDALRLIEGHSLTLSSHVRKSSYWYNRILIPLYHPGQRAMMHRSYANQRSDYEFVKYTLKNLDNNKNIYGKTKSDVIVVLKFIMDYLQVNQIGYFRLHKLFYLIEYYYQKEYGERLTSAYIVRQKDGPYVLDLNFKKITNYSSEFKFKNNTLFYERKISSLFMDAEKNYKADVGINRIDADFVEKIISKYAKSSDAQLKTAAYFTFRELLISEMDRDEGMYNFPLLSPQ